MFRQICTEKLHDLVEIGRELGKDEERRPWLCDAGAVVELPDDDGSSDR